jgi:hypothetical protein
MKPDMSEIFPRVTQRGSEEADNVWQLSERIDAENDVVKSDGGYECGGERGEIGMWVSTDVEDNAGNRKSQRRMDIMILLGVGYEKGYCAESDARRWLAGRGGRFRPCAESGGVWVEWFVHACGGGVGQKSV